MLESVLIIDQSFTVSDMLANVLRERQFLVATASTAEQAREILSSESFDYILADVDTPDFDGLTLILELTSLRQNPALILMAHDNDTASIQPTRELALSFSINLIEVLTKPISKDKLLSVFEDIVVGGADAGSAVGLSETDFIRGLMTDGLSPIYQPRFSLKDNTVTGVEVYARWVTDKGVLGAQTVLNLAHEKGHMEVLTYRIMELAIDQLGRWREEGVKLNMSINLSSGNMVKPDFPDVVQRLADQSGIDHSQITLKVGETALGEEEDMLLRVMAELSKRGFNLALDNFEAGFGSLMRLRKISFNELIVDRNFLNWALEDTAALTILESAVDLTHKLNIKSAIAGVEDKRHIDLAKRLDVDTAQGYFLAKPMTPDEFLSWYKALG